MLSLNLILGVVVPLLRLGKWLLPKWHPLKTVDLSPQSSCNPESRIQDAEP